MSTEGCVAQTAIAGKEEGYKVTGVPSACATVHPELERIALAYIERVVGVRLADMPDTFSNPVAHIRRAHRWHERAEGEKPWYRPDGVHSPRQNRASAG
jgi:hypothetical protein